MTDTTPARSADIVERLRMTGDPWPQYADVPLCMEAADEIEALRDHVDALRLVATTNEPEALRLQAEIKRLRAALQNLTKDPPQSLAREPDTDCEVVLKMREIARRALEKKP